MKQKQDSWNGSQGDAQKVQLDFNFAWKPFFFQGLTDLKGKGTGYGAWQISRSNQLTVLESESSVVLGGVRSMPESSRSRCCPGGNSSEGAGDLQGKAGIDVLDGPDADSGNSKGIDDDKFVVFDLRKWHNIAEPNQGQGKAHPKKRFNYLTQSKDDGLTHGQAGQQQRNNGDQVARSWALSHSQFNPSKGAKR